MPTSITSSGITFDDATTQTTSATKAGGIGTTQLANAAVTAAKLDGAQTGSAPVYGCRAWVSFDGTSVNGSNECTIRGNGNVSKVVRNATGDYTVTMQTAMPDTNYAITGSSGGTSSTSNGAVYSYDQLSAKTTTTFRIATLSSAGSPINTPHVMVMVIR